MNLGHWGGSAAAAALLAAAWALIAAAPTPAAAAPDQPNFVVILTDDQDDQDSTRLMPHLAAMAAQGVTFTNSFVDLPLCCPSRVSFLTGQSAHNNRITGNKPPNGGYAEFSIGEASNLGAWLQAAGYRTAMMGKLMNGYGEGQAAEHVHIMPGWNEWDVLTTRQDSTELDSDHVGYRYYGYTLNENGVLVDHGKKPEDYQTDVLAAKGEDFIRSSAGPFLLVLEPIAPHGAHGDDAVDGEKGFPEPAPRYVAALPKLPFKPSPNFNEADLSDKTGAFQRMAAVQTGGSDQFQDPGVMAASFADRRRTMLAVDDMLQRLIDALRETGKLDNTYIIFTSDNGYSQGAHRWQGKVVLFEEAARVPLVIFGPGTGAGRTRSQLVNNLDVVATIVERAGATPAGRTLDGRSLAPVLADAAAPWRSALLIENHHERAVRTKSWMYGESATYWEGAESELYSMNQDPLQLRNLTATGNNPTRDAQTALRSLLDRIRNCRGEACWYDGPTPPARK
jgi:N-acetylglucosamine-6-sulfatase